MAEVQAVERLAVLQLLLVSALPLLPEMLPLVQILTLSPTRTIFLLQMRQNTFSLSTDVSTMFKQTEQLTVTRWKYPVIVAAKKCVMD
jgi:hypothetical protein